MNATYGCTVSAGLIPGQPMDEFTQTWLIGREEHERNVAHGVGLLGEGTPWAKATAYAAELLAPAPNAVNWVRVDWVWF